MPVARVPFEFDSAAMHYETLAARAKVKRPGFGGRCSVGWVGEPTSPECISHESADFHEQPLKLDTLVKTPRRDALDYFVSRQLVDEWLCTATTFGSDEHRHARHATANHLWPGELQRGSG